MPGILLNTLSLGAHLCLTTLMNYYYSYFSDEKSEAQEGLISLSEVTQSVSGMVGIQTLVLSTWALITVL